MFFLILLENDSRIELVNVKRRREYLRKHKSNKEQYPVFYFVQKSRALLEM